MSSLIYIAQRICWFVSRLLFVSCLLAFGGCTELPKPIRVDGATNCKGKSTPLDRLSGVSPVKLVFVDKDGRAVQLDETERKMDWLKSVKIAKAPAPSVYALETNQKVEDVAIDVQKEVVDSAVTYVHPIYRFAERRLDEKKHVNRLLMMLFDEGKRALMQDPTKERRKAIVSYIEDTLEDGDAFGTGVLHFLGNIPFVFGESYTSKQYLSTRGRNYFAYHHFRSKEMYKESAQARSALLEDKGGDEFESYPEVFRWSEASAFLIGNVIIQPFEIETPEFVPSLLVLLTDLDEAILSGKNDTFESVKTSLALFGTGRAIPFFAVLHPKPSDVTRAMWDTYTNQLCQLSKLNGGVSWGNVFQLRANQLDAKDIKKRLDFAYHALKGHTTLDFKYNISGDSLQQGTRYVLEFYLSLEDEENGTQQTSSIPVRIEFQP